MKLGLIIPIKKLYIQMSEGMGTGLGLQLSWGLESLLLLHFLYFDSCCYFKSHGAAPRTSRASSVSSTGSGQAPTTRPPTPPQQGGRGGGTMRQSGHYRTPAPHVTPPAVPGHYGPGSYTMASGAPTRREGGYASTNTVMGQVHMPPVGMARPMSQNPGQAPGMPSPSVLNQMLGYNTNGMQALSQGHVGRSTGSMLLTAWTSHITSVCLCVDMWEASVVWMLCCSIQTYVCVYVVRLYACVHVYKWMKSVNVYPCMSFPML